MPRIAEIMTYEVSTISPEENIQRAAQLMEELNVDSLPVCEHQKLVGMITDRDITVRITSAAESPENTKVREVMSSEVIWCTEDQSVEEVTQKMIDSRIRRIPVLDISGKRMIGIATLDELAPQQSAQYPQTMAGIPTSAQGALAGGNA